MAFVRQKIEYDERTSGVQSVNVLIQRKNSKAPLLPAALI